jgi:hypothetical protein
MTGGKDAWWHESIKRRPVFAHIYLIYMTFIDASEAC